MLYCTLHHNDTIIMMQEDFFIKIYTSHFLARVRKGCSRFACERVLETEYNWNILTPKLWPPALCLFSFSRAAQPEAQDPLCWLMASFTASYQQLLWSPNSIGVPEGPLGRVWLSLPHLVSNCLQLNWQLSWLPSWLSYIIVQRQLDRPLDLWNRTFDRHQEEITVMQFTGHSLPVHQSMSVPWEFFSSSHFISEFPPTRFPLITAMRMCHLLLVHHLEMAFLAGSKGQNITMNPLV